MRKYILTAMAIAISVSVCSSNNIKEKLKFDASKGIKGSITMPQGDEVKYTAYTKLYFVTNVEDEKYQYMNVFVPEGATQNTPIFLRTYIGGYMASEAAFPNPDDATGRALKEGYVVAIPGSRGSNSMIVQKKKEVYTGRAPKGLLDLKAAIRYLRLFDNEMQGNAEMIITDGTSAGGAMSALIGATGNNPIYDEYLKAMGAADKRDDVFAAICFCPITDLEHADMAYEWLYGVTNNNTRYVNEEQAAISNELAGMFKDYINSLNLRKPDGSLLTADNYADYIKKEIIRSAQVAKDAGADIPLNIGFTFSEKVMPNSLITNNNNGDNSAVNGGRQNPPMLKTGSRQNVRRRDNPKETGEYILDLDMETYLKYIAEKQPLKNVPAFDSKGIAGETESAENDLFGDENGNSVNFTAYSAKRNGNTVSEKVKKNVYLLNPMNFIGDGKSETAPHWYIRHGAIDRDTAFPIPINLATKLQNNGKNVNFMLAWNRNHSGDYSLDELFNWIKSITRK